MSVETALNVLLVNISQHRLYNPGLVENVRESFEKLKLELEYLKSFLKDFTTHSHKSEYLKATLKETRAIIGEAEDAVESYIVLASAQKSKCWVSRAFHYKRLGDARDQIEQVAHKVKNLNEGNIRHGLVVLRYQSIAHENQSTTHEAPQVEEERVIGFDGPAEQVKKLLVEGPEKLEVISIAGMVGLGKTTLAKMVYRDPDIDYEYMIQAFVYISREYDKREVLLNILGSFARLSDEVRNMPTDSVQKHLYRELEGKQYLIVLDDVCELKDWDSFKGAFPRNNKRCRVLITTTNARLGEHANSLYMLNFLSMEDSKLLLCRRVFYKDDFPNELLPYVPEIVLKCDGLPLAITLIAGILINHPERPDWWKQVSENASNYVGRGLRGNSVIAMMYEHLPTYLKPCFMYLGVFPEDYEIPVWKLLRLWVSEGFIEREGDYSLEDVAEQYLIELTQRNLVVVGQKRSNGKIKTCRINNTIRVFCRKEAMEENLFQEIRKDNRSRFIQSEDPSLDIHRRLFMNDPSILEYVSGPVSGKHVRSFLTFQKKVLEVQPRQDPSILKAFKLLKVLEAHSLKFTQLPPDLVTKLILLKYLAISSSDISIIPSSISSLWFLQTLIVSTTSPFLKIQTELWKLPQFRHLHCDAPAIFPSPRFKNQKSEAQVPQTNVQTLCTIAPESFTRDVLNHTPMLKKLSIRGRLTVVFEVSGEASIISELRKFQQLENLKLENDDENDRIYSLPRYFPERLTKLTLMNTALEWKKIADLGELENLTVLKLKRFAFKGTLWDTERGGFLRLEHLFIGETDLMSWTISGTHFPRLNTLVLNNCSQLQGLPKGLEDIRDLKSLVLYYTNSKVVSDGRNLQAMKQQKTKRGDKKNTLKLSIYPAEY